MATGDLTDLEARVRTECGDSSTAPTVLTDAAQIDRWLLEGVDQLSVLRPVKKTQDITPLEDTSLYTAPTDIRAADSAHLVDTASAEQTETPLLVVYEPHLNKVRFPTLPNFCSSGYVVRLYYSASHVKPTSSVASTTLPVDLEPAIIHYACHKALDWTRRKMAIVRAGGGAPLKFSRGRYSEDGASSMKELREDAKWHLEEFRKLAGVKVAGVASTKGAGDLPEGRPPSIAGGRIGESGWIPVDSSAVRPFVGGDK